MSRRPGSAPARRSSSSKGSEKRQIDPAVIERLSKPVKHESKLVSASYDDINNCTFKPKITKMAESESRGSFLERVEREMNKYKESQKREIKLDDKTFTFKPEINRSKSLSRRNSTSDSSGPNAFIERMAVDAANRKTRMEQEAKKSLFDFKPVIMTKNKKDSKDKGKEQKEAAQENKSFLDRLQNDLEQRELNRKRLVAEALHEQSDHSFQPAITTRKNDGQGSFSEFLARMETDIDGREKKERYRAKLLGLTATPDKAAKMKSLSRSSSSASLNGTRRRQSFS